MICFQHIFFWIFSNYQWWLNLRIHIRPIFPKSLIILIFTVISYIFLRRMGLGSNRKYLHRLFFFKVRSTLPWETRPSEPNWCKRASPSQILTGIDTESSNSRSKSIGFNAVSNYDQTETSLSSLLQSCPFRVSDLPTALHWRWFELVTPFML